MRPLGLGLGSRDLVAGFKRGMEMGYRHRAYRYVVGTEMKSVMIS